MSSGRLKGIKSKASYSADSAWAGSGRKKKKDNTSSACSMIVNRVTLNIN